MSDQTQEARVPALTLWATMAAEWLQCASDPVVMLGSDAAGSSEAVTARTTGVEGGELSQQMGPSEAAMRRQGVASGKVAEVTRRVSSGAEDGPCGRSNTSIGR